MHSPLNHISIDDFLMLNEAVQDGWTLLIGSAISHVEPAALPLAPEAAQSLASLSTTILNLDRVQWRRTSLAEEVFSAAMAIKFEMLVSRLREHQGDLVVESLCKLFELKQPSEEHEAIAKLLRLNRVRTVFTTNFDVGIELAAHFPSNEVGYLPISYDNGRWPRLVKLHGSTDSPKSIVATLDRLGDSRQQEAVREAFFKIAPKRMLIVGYSGAGDLDVLPSVIDLGEAGIPIYWADLPNKQLPQVPGIIRVDHDLSQPNESILMRWSGNLGRFDRWTDRSHGPVAPEIHQPTQIEAAHAALAVLLEARRGEAAVALLNWASTHVQYFEVDPNEAGIAYERARAYLSAAHYLIDAEDEAGRKGQITRQIGLRASIAFVLRQAGRADEAKHWYENARLSLKELDLSIEDLPLADVDSVFREIQPQIRKVPKPLDSRAADRIESELNQLSVKANSDVLIRSLVLLALTDLRMAQHRWKEAAVFAQSGLEKLDAIHHLEGCSRAARQLACADKRKGRIALLRVIRQIRKTHHAERDLWKNWVALLLTLVPLGSVGIQDLVLRNNMLLRLICWNAERRIRHIECKYRVGNSAIQP
jgi:hypothetical protein